MINSNLFGTRQRRRNDKETEKKNRMMEKRKDPGKESKKSSVQLYHKSFLFTQIIAALLFLIGSILFFWEATMNAAKVLFGVGSAFFLLDAILYVKEK